MAHQARLLSLFLLSVSVTICLLFLILALVTPYGPPALAQAPNAVSAPAEIGDPTLVKDIYTGSALLSSNPVNIAVSGNKLYFAAHDSTRGNELWLSDGSSSGTRIVKDIIPGAPNSDPELMVDVNGALFFKNEADSALWRSDGTISGTQRIYKFPEGGSIGNEMVQINGRLFFVATEHTGEVSQLWRSDGSVTSTVMVSRSLAGQGAQVGSQPSELTVGSKGIFYVGISDEGDETLFESDGTAGVSRQLDVENPTGLHLAGSILYFSGRDAIHGNELWKSNGTPSGTAMVADIFSGTNDSNVENIVDISSTVYFVAQSDFNRRAIWRSQGDSLNTYEVYWTPNLTPARLTPVGDHLFFVDLTTGDLLVSYGSPDNTTVVRTFSSVANQSPDHLVDLDGVLYFIINDGPDAGLWRSDGTPDGTQRVKEHTPSPQAESAGQPIAFGDHLYYEAWDSVHGWELWISDGSGGGTQLLANIANDIRSTFTSCPAWTSAQNLLFFQVGCRDVAQLWRSDGEITGTIPLITFTLEPSITAQFVLTSFQDAAFLGYTKLWRSDGTVGGTQEVASIAPLWFETFHNQLFMAASDGNTGVELWRSDGTTPGTVQVIDISEGISDSLNAEHAVAGDRLYFVANDGEHGAELWKSDGTKAGTGMVTDLEPGFDDAGIHHLAGAGIRVFFLRTTPDEGQELWTSDGTEAGTHLVRDIYPGEQDGVESESPFLALNGVLYFAANDGEHGFELWRSDGSEAGTQMVRDIFLGPFSAHPQSFVLFEGKLYFGADDGVHGSELWRSDGSEAGTQMVADLAPGADNSRPAGMSVVDNQLLFSAGNHDNGNELWISDGTVTGTVQFADLAPGERASNPNDFHLAGQHVFFVANDGVTGNELWTANLVTQQKGGTIYFPFLKQ